jgi:nucleoside-diphosphate-sugar epimerase
MNLQNKTIILPGGAGLVGQNLVVRLKERGYSKLIVLDKHHANLKILKQIQPNILIEYADLAEPGDWQKYFQGDEEAAVIMLQAQIGGNDYEEFQRNNIDSTKLILDLVK